MITKEKYAELLKEKNTLEEECMRVWYSYLTVFPMHKNTCYELAETEKNSFSIKTTLFWGGSEDIAHYEFEVYLLELTEEVLLINFNELKAKRELDKITKAKEVEENELVSKRRQFEALKIELGM